ncbi:MAG: SGNH/GDSL hydrolase family protein [Acidobacteria bacterium]|nr:SGNH/GDSL hydrolase family protein [Acidobacteriota bacterium]
MLRPLLAATLVLPLGILSLWAQDNPAYRKVVDNPALPRVLLIGDSISVGYTVPTQDLLKGVANVHRIPENGGPTIKGLEKIDEWLGSSKWDVIHFNWGLHDLKFMDDGKHQVALADYERNLETLTKRLEKTGAKLIWASTTPVPSAKVSPPRKDSDVVAYNQAAARVMQRHGIPTDDLYGLAKPILGMIQRPANVHYTPEGSKDLAEQVVASIRKQLEPKR